METKNYSRSNLCELLLSFCRLRGRETSVAGRCPQDKYPPPPKRCPQGPGALGGAAPPHLQCLGGPLQAVGVSPSPTQSDLQSWAPAPWAFSCLSAPGPRSRPTLCPGSLCSQDKCPEKPGSEPSPPLPSSPVLCLESSLQALHTVPVFEKVAFFSHAEVT